MRRFSLFFLSFFILKFLPAQTAGYTDFNNYTPLYCSGEIPTGFLMSVQDKFEQDVKDEKKSSTNKYVSKSKGDFLLQSNYFVDLLLQSGKVLFGDSVTAYINSVADRVLVNEPDLRAKLTFYGLRSAEPNAFSTDQGIIFVTVGLLAQLENEAQLAFILSHEISHFERRHTMTVYMEGQRIFSDNNQRRSLSLDDKIRDFSNHEKASEFEADSLGLVRLSRTGYDCSEAMGAMFVLQFAHLPFDDYDFPVHSFERPLMAFPKTLYMDSVRAISFDGDNSDDEYSSHPNIARRRERLEDQFEDLNNCGTVRFADSQQRFELVRNICRFETIRLQLIIRDYCTAIYNAQYLLQSYPESLYLKRCIAKALYGLAKYKNEKEFNNGMDNYGAVEGKQQQCFYVFQRMTAEQITAVALRYMYDVSVVDSTNVTLNNMLYDLGTEAVYFHKMTVDAVNRSVVLYNESLADTIRKDTAVAPVAEKKDTATTKSGTGYVSKYDKLKNEKKEKDKKDLSTEKIVEKSKFHMLAFGDIIADPQVISFFKTCEQRSEEQKQAEENANAKYKGMSDYEIRKAKQREKKKGAPPKPLGIDTLLVVDPFYLYATEWVGFKMKESEDGRYELCDNVENIAAQAELPIVLFSMKEFSKDDIDKYNELALLNEWIEESINHDDFVMIQSEAEFVQPVCEKYHTDEILITGVVTFKQKRENRGGIILFSVICYPILPIGLVYALTPEHETYLLSGIYKLSDGTTEMTRQTKLKSKARKGYIRSQLYDVFVGIQQEPEEKNNTKRR